MGQSLFTVLSGAGIPAERAERPIRDLDRDVFQMDIPREPAERLRLWLGAADNEVEVLSACARLGQAVLKIREPRRPWIDRIRIREGRVTRDQVEAFVRETGGRVLRPRGSSWLVERWTDPAERRFLIGFDERHLFAAQVPAGTTVAEARDALKPSEVREAEARGLGPVIRQGEWFFVRPSPEGEASVRGWLAGNRNALERNRALPFEGQPHRAGELVRVPAGVASNPPRPEVNLFVRGRIRHPDHSTVSFDRWRRAVLNAAVRRRTFMARGLYWLD